jgi:hypothetical protein
MPIEHRDEHLNVKEKQSLQGLEVLTVPRGWGT